MSMHTMKEPNDSGINILKPGTRVFDVADACRDAALAFAWSGHFWTKRELAEWLVGPYARAVIAIRWGLPTQTPIGRTSQPPASGVHAVSRSHRADGSIPAASIARLLASAHAEILDLLRQVWSWRNDASFAREAIDEGLVAGVIDERGAIGYAPIDTPRMRLADRVRSLFLADYLTRPEAYESFAVCPRCDGATFDFYVPYEGAHEGAHRSHAAECCARSTLSVRRRETFPFGLRESASPLLVARPARPSKEVIDVSTLLVMKLGTRLALEGTEPSSSDPLEDDGELTIDFDACEPASEPERLTLDFASCEEQAPPAPMVEVLGEFEIDVDFDADDANAEDFDDFGDLRDTIIDPIELWG